MTFQNAHPTHPELKIPPRLLLGPGPSQVEPRILQSMALPLLGHLDPTFLEIMDRIQDMLRMVFETRNELTLAVPGTGTSGMEAAVANAVEPGDPVLVLANGYFSLRIADMARRYGGEVELLEAPWGEAFTAEAVQDALKARRAKVVALVHAETSTGVLQPLEAISRVVHEHGGLLLVDAVTSLGGIPVKVDETGIDVCYSGTQKCLGCPPGLAPITLSPRAVEALEKRRHAVSNWYLDLMLLRKYWGKERAYHHTAPISTVYALYEGLRSVEEEGLDNRFARHSRNAKLLWEGLEANGFQLHAPLAHRLPTLTTVCIPDGVDDMAVRKSLLEDYHIEIGGGLGNLKGKVWRIGLMGYSSQMENVLLLLAALERLVQ
jgi:alanine-glyoxylate transaminase/serine-glyoxylate transaminase/serine-pyruvate transaminase